MRRSTINTIIGSSAGAIGAGAALMYFLDPDRGARRRAFVRDKTVSAGRQTGRFFSKAGRDLAHRAQGVGAGTRSLFGMKSRPDDDAVLEERVRSRIGRVISNPRAIEVSASNGCVHLSGNVLDSEIRDVLSCVLSTHGVSNIRNELTGHSRHESGASQMDNGHAGNSNSRVAPGIRLLLAGVGGALAFYGSRRRGISGKLLQATGASLLGSELTHSGLNLFGRGA